MIISSLALSMLLLGNPLTISDAWDLSQTLASEYIDEGYSVTVHEIDVPSLGAPLDSINAISIVESGFGFSETDVPFAVLLFRDEIVKITFEEQIGFSEQRYQINEIQPYSLYCDSSGETALVLGLPSTDWVTPAVFIDLETGSRTSLSMNTKRMVWRPYHQLDGRTLLLQRNGHWEGYDVSGRSLFMSDSIQRNSEMVLFDQGEGILFSETHTGRGATVTRMDRKLNPVWTLDTGLPSIELILQDRMPIGFYHFTYNRGRGEFVKILCSFDLETGELLSTEELTGNIPSVLTSPNGEYAVSRLSAEDQASHQNYFESYRMNQNERELLYSYPIASGSFFLNLKVLAVSNSGHVLMQISDRFTSITFFLVNAQGEVIWMGKPIRGDEFPSFTGTNTLLFPSARLDSSGTRVIYRDHHCIRIVSVSETP